MKKLSKVLGMISLILSLFCIIILLQFLFSGQSQFGDWSSFGFYLIALVFVLMAVFLSIPFLILLFVIKPKHMKFYLMTHLSFLSISIISFFISLNS